jgi:ATP-dependent Lhr-like helicase
VKTSTLALALRSEGFSVEQHDGFLLVENGDETSDLWTVLGRISAGDARDFFGDAGNLVSEKFHPYLHHELLVLDACSSKVDLSCLSRLSERLRS